MSSAFNLTEFYLSQVKKESLMFVFLICPTDSLEEADNSHLRAEFIGLMNLFWACSFGHRMGIHAKLLDTDVVEAFEEGSPELGYIIRVRLKVNTLQNASVNLSVF